MDLSLFEKSIINDAVDILPDDIKNVLKDVETFQDICDKSFHNEHELDTTNKILKQEVARCRESEEKLQSTVESLTNDLAKMQSCFSSSFTTKQENDELKKKIMEYEKNIDELSKSLENERLSCHRLMESNKKRYEEEAEKNLACAHMEADNLQEQLLQTTEISRKQLADLQAQLRNLEHAKNEEIRVLTYEFQEKVNRLQTALTATQAENRNIRDRMQFNTATYQKKIQDLERQKEKTSHPALRVAGPSSGGGRGSAPASSSASRSAKNLPSLSFLAPVDVELLSSEDSQPTVPAQNKRKRKLFVQKNTPE